IIPSAEYRVSLGGSKERLRTARADAEQQVVVISGAVHDGEHVVHDGAVHSDLCDGVLQMREILAAQNAGSCRSVLLASRLADNFAFALSIRIADPQAHQKPVELRFRQRISA